MLPIEQLQELIHGKKVAFIGAGVSHKRCIEQFVAMGAKVTLCDQKKSLKEYLIQEKVPAGEREALPLLADGSHVLWVIGHRISSAVKVTESTERVLRIHIRGGKENG